MNFITPEFIFFFLLILIPIRIASHSVRPYIFLIANCYFYLHTGISAFFVLVAITFFTFFMGQFLDNSRAGKKKKRVLAIGIIPIILVLCFFKYYELIDFYSAANIFGISWDAISFLERDITYIAGISFFIFQAIAYLIEVYTTRSYSISFIHLFIYLSFFPTVLSGPIMRPAYFADQMQSRSIDPDFALEGFLYILSGIIKKVVIAGYLSENIVKYTFAAPDSYTSPAVLIGVYGYAAVIFCDFSGYTDIAIGIGRLMGFSLPENFLNPYFSVNLQDFWRRWHITLSQWIRDYIYFPLGGSKKGNVYINILITMAICGIWHGSTFNFVLWGFLHGLGLVFLRFLKKIRFIFPTADKILTRILPTPIAAFFTFQYVTLLWIFFNSESIEHAFFIIDRIFLFSQDGMGFPLLAVPAILSVFFMHKFGKKIFNLSFLFLKKIPFIFQGVIIGFLTWVIMNLGPDGILPFIYFGF